MHRPWEPVDHQLTRVITTYWANYITTANPNGTGLPHWPGYSVSDKQIKELGEKQQAKSLPDKEALDFMYKIISVNN